MPSTDLLGLLFRHGCLTKLVYILGIYQNYANNIYMINITYLTQHCHVF